jgi:GxxExxY protein
MRLNYKNIELDCGFRIDLPVGGILVVEIKAVDKLIPIHTAQVLTYLKLSRCKLGILLNFNGTTLTTGIKRVILNL